MRYVKLLIGIILTVSIKGNASVVAHLLDSKGTFYQVLSGDGFELTGSEQLKGAQVLVIKDNSKDSNIQLVPTTDDLSPEEDVILVENIYTNEKYLVWSGYKNLHPVIRILKFLDLLIPLEEPIELVSSSFNKKISPTVGTIFSDGYNAVNIFWWDIAPDGTSRLMYYNVDNEGDIIDLSTLLEIDTYYNPSNQWSNFIQIEQENKFFYLLFGNLSNKKIEVIKFTLAPLETYDLLNNARAQIIEIGNQNKLRPLEEKIYLVKNNVSDLLKRYFNENIEKHLTSSIIKNFSDAVTSGLGWEEATSKAIDDIEEIITYSGFVLDPNARAQIIEIGHRKRNVTLSKIASFDFPYSIEGITPQVMISPSGKTLMSIWIGEDFITYSTTDREGKWKEPQYLSYNDYETLDYILESLKRNIKLYYP